MAEALTDQMLREEADVFNAMLHHRFTRDIAADKLPQEVFDRYLLIEGAFVETAIGIFGYAVAKAEDLADRRKLIAALDALANEQLPYFDAAFASRNIDRDPRVLAEPSVIAFRDGMLEIARDGAFSEILSALFAAEWMYYTWCSRVAGAPISDPSVNDWVHLHAAPDFAGQARWLRVKLDEIGAGLSIEDRKSCVRIFGRVQRLEIAFHDAAYGSE